MTFEKQSILHKPLLDVWNFLVDPDKMARCIPGVESVETIDSQNYRAKVRVKVAFVSATFNLNIQILERRDPTFMRSKIGGRDGRIGSSISAETTLELSEISALETLVRYGANFVFTGHVASLGRSIMQAKTEEQTALFMENLRRNIGDVGVGVPATDTGTAATEQARISELQ